MRVFLNTLYALLVEHLDEEEREEFDDTLTADPDDDELMSGLVEALR